MLLANLRGLSGHDRARTALGARSSWSSIRRLRGVQPVHMIVHVVPKGKHQGHATAKRLAHLLHASVLLKSVPLTEYLLVECAGGIRKQRLIVEALPFGLGVFDLLPILDVEAVDLTKVPRVGSIDGDEPSHDGERPRRVDAVVTSRTKEGVVPHPPGVEVATRLVALTIATGTFTTVQAVDRARMGSVCRIKAVRLPNVHLGTTRPMLPNGAA